MSARELLQSIEARGGVASIRREGDLVKLNVSPRGVALELASDIQRFKPALLELLDAPHIGATVTGREPDAATFPRDFDARAAFERLPERQGGLNRAAQVERARQSIPPRFRRLLELGDRSNGRTGEAREVWALAVAVALLDAGKSPISRPEGDFSP